MVNLIPSNTKELRANTFRAQRQPFSSVKLLVTSVFAWHSNQWLNNEWDEVDRKKPMLIENGCMCVFWQDWKLWGKNRSIDNHWKVSISPGSPFIWWEVEVHRKYGAQPPQTKCHQSRCSIYLYAVLALTPNDQTAPHAPLHHQPVVTDTRAAPRAPPSGSQSPVW